MSVQSSANSNCPTKEQINEYLRNKVHEDICSTCHGGFEKPVYLVNCSKFEKIDSLCAHIFCLDCLKGWADFLHDTCPFCNKSWKVYSEDADPNAEPSLLTYLMTGRITSSNPEIIRIDASGLKNSDGEEIQTATDKEISDAFPPEAHHKKQLAIKIYTLALRLIICIQLGVLSIEVARPRSRIFFPVEAYLSPPEAYRVLIMGISLFCLHFFAHLASSIPSPQIGEANRTLGKASALMFNAFLGALILNSHLGRN